MINQNIYQQKVQTYPNNLCKKEYRRLEQHRLMLQRICEWIVKILLCKYWEIPNWMTILNRQDHHWTTTHTWTKWWTMVLRTICFTRIIMIVCFVHWSKLPMLRRMTCNVPTRQDRKYKKIKAKEYWTKFHEANIM